MRMILFSALIALGVGLVGPTASSAAGIGAGIDTAAKNASLIEPARWYCRYIRVCRDRPWGRECHRERVCRHW